MSCVVFFSRDPGPTNVLLAVHAGMRAGGPLAHLPSCTAAKIFARAPGLREWRRAGIAAEEWPTIATPEQAASLLRDLGAVAVVTGASDIDEPTDRLLWQAARAVGIPCHVFIDHPANLRARLVDAPAKPTHLYVPHADYRLLLADLQSMDTVVVVVGDLHIAHLKAQTQQLLPEIRAAIRRNWGAAQSDAVVLFASECGREMVAAGRSYPYDEMATLARLVALIAERATLCGKALAPDSTIVVVRPHPRDTPGKYSDHVRAASPRVVVSADESPFAAISSAEMVVGMDSTMLREALALGVAALSLTGSTQAGIPVYGD
jgi:hypothetical protein